MRPELIHFSDKFIIHSYPAMLALAFLTCTLGASYESQRQNPSFFIPPRAGVWGFLGALFGAKVFWILQYASWRQLLHAFRIWEPGLVFYGGLIGGGIAVALYFRVTKVPLIRGLDTAAPYLALGEAITRIGCFLNGCCWGTVCHVPWGVTFPVGSLAYDQQLQDGLISPLADHPLPVHPTQLYMVIGLVIVFFVIRKSLGRVPRGVPMMLYFTFYGVVRFTVEVFRGDSARSILGMTVSQAISLAFFVVGLTMVLLLFTRQKDMSHPVMASDATSESSEIQGHP